MVSQVTREAEKAICAERAAQAEAAAGLAELAALREELDATMHERGVRDHGLGATLCSASGRCTRVVCRVRSGVTCRGSGWVRGPAATMHQRQALSPRIPTPHHTRTSSGSSDLTPQVTPTSRAGGCVHTPISE
jgi:hypothetical protein